MRRLISQCSAVLVLSLLGMLVIASFVVRGERVSQAQTAMTPTPSPAPRVSSSRDWILLDTVPPGSSQIAYGREIYRLVCSACHGDKGQGLTPEWRMTWAPQDQNCWQSKCHGLNHPPDGFFLPYSPPITNLSHSRRYLTALELQGYIRQYMPWQDPGSLLDERAWQVTAYVLKLNDIDAGPMLTAETAARIRLAPESASVPLEATSPSSGEATTQDNVTSPTSNIMLVLISATCAMIFLLAGGVSLWRKAKH